VTLKDLPYEYTALAPAIGEQTLRIHHGKHHAKYVATTNEMIKGTDMEGDDVVTILKKAFNNNQGLFNNAAQSYNHEFYWQVCITIIDTIIHHILHIHTKDAYIFYYDAPSP
jgi:Fe-Mn family superoxide dismutase